jgi:adenylate cyclase
VSAILTITEPTGRTWEIALEPGRTYSIGRAKENDIVLNDRRVSRRHAHITSDNDAYTLVDGYVENGRLVRSVNHAFVNGVPRTEHLLEQNDVIRIGETDLAFRRIEVSFQPAKNVHVSIPPADAAASPVSTPPAEIRAEAVKYDDSPLGHTQLQISASEIIGRQSHGSIEASKASPEEIKDLRRKAKMLELVYEMSRTVSTVFDLNEIFDKATDLIFRGTPADRVVAMLTGENENGAPGELHQIAVRTRDSSAAGLTEKLTVSRTITRKVMRERVALLSQDARSDEQFHGAESIVTQGVRSTICAPLITESSVHGVVYADRLDPFAAFTPDHLELIGAVAAQAAVIVETVRAHTRLAREEVARANYSRFMPEYVVKQLLDDPGSFRLGGANQLITVLFADIRGFTALSERENPERVVSLLNKYFSAMSEIIFSHGGTLDKYIGDGLMAIFGAPTATPDDAVNALMAAVAMQRRIVSLNDELAAEGLPRLSVGIGLHTGEATIGYIGSDRRSEYTAIGDTVNLAARLESNARGGQILISEATAAAGGSAFRLTAREPINVKNRVQPVALYEVETG